MAPLAVPFKGIHGLHPMKLSKRKHLDAKRLQKSWQDVSLVFESNVRPNYQAGLHQCGRADALPIASILLSPASFATSAASFSTLAFLIFNPIFYLGGFFLPRYFLWQAWPDLC